MKITRFIKLRSFSHGPVDLAIEHSHNPLKRQVQVPHPTHAFTTEWLDQFKVPLNLDEAQEKAWVISFMRIMSWLISFL